MSNYILLEGKTDILFLNAVLRKKKLISDRLKNDRYEIVPDEKNKAQIDSFGISGITGYLTIINNTNTQKNISTGEEEIIKRKKIIIIFDGDNDYKQNLDLIYNKIQEIFSVHIKTFEKNIDLDENNTFIKSYASDQLTLDLYLYCFKTKGTKDGSYESLLWDSISNDHIKYKEISNTTLENAIKLYNDDNKNKINTNINTKAKRRLAIFLSIHQANVKNSDAIFNPFEAYLRNDEFYGEIIEPIESYENFLEKAID